MLALQVVREKQEEEEQESAKQWEELIGLEQRRRKLQHSQELER